MRASTLAVSLHRKCCSLKRWRDLIRQHIGVRPQTIVPVSSFNLVFFSFSPWSETKIRHENTKTEVTKEHIALKPVSKNCHFLRAVRLLVDRGESRACGDRSINVPPSSLIEKLKFHYANETSFEFLLRIASNMNGSLENSSLLIIPIRIYFRKPPHAYAIIS